MGNVNTNVARAVQRVNNDVAQISEEVCRADCQNIQSGNTIIISGSTTGDVMFNQQCRPKATCVMNQTFTTRIQDILDSLQKQTASTQSAFLSFVVNSNTNVADVEQTITNQITQLLSSTCQASSQQLQTDNLIYVKDSTTGNIGFNQAEEPTTACVMNNIGRVVAYNDMVAKSDQTSKTQSIFVIIVIAIVAMVVLCGLMLLLFLTSRSGRETVHNLGETQKVALNTLAQNPQLLAAL